MISIKYTIYLGAFAILASSTISCENEKTESKVLTQEVAFIKEGELTLKKPKTDSVVAKLDIEIADDAYQTSTGLMYRSSMPENEGMLFIFEDEKPRSFYMKNTEFPLDIIYLNGKKEIVSIQEDAVPLDETSLPSGEPAKYVLEVNGGLSAKWGLEKGDSASYKTMK